MYFFVSQSMGFIHKLTLPCQDQYLVRCQVEQKKWMCQLFTQFFSAKSWTTVSIIFVNHFRTNLWAFEVNFPIIGKVEIDGESAIYWEIGHRGTNADPSPSLFNKRPFVTWTWEDICVCLTLDKEHYFVTWPSNLDNWKKINQLWNHLFYFHTRILFWNPTLK
jgi:hypothetical protein